MNAQGKFRTGLLLGLLAAVVDVVPMAIQGLGWHECVSAFLHWTGLGIIMAYLRMPLPGWMAGAAVGILSGIPVAVLILRFDPPALAPITISSVLLGAGLGHMTKKFIHDKEPS